MVKSSITFEFEAGDEPYITTRHADIGKSYERHAATLYIRDAEFTFAAVADWQAPSCTIQYATPEQIDAHIAALQELRETWPTVEITTYGEQLELVAAG